MSQVRWSEPAWMRWREPTWLIVVTTLGCFAGAASHDPLWWRVSGTVLGIGGLLQLTARLSQ